jgi:hypothetical protein
MSVTHETPRGGWLKCLLKILFFVTLSLRSDVKIIKIRIKIIIKLASF